MVCVLVTVVMAIGSFHPSGRGLMEILQTTTVQRTLPVKRERGREGGSGGLYSDAGRC